MKFSQLNMPPADSIGDAKNIETDALDAIKILDQIGRRSLDSTTFADAQYYLPEFEDKQHSCFVTRDADGDICAAADYIQYNDHAYIQHFAVDRAYRGLGVGASFMDYLGRVTHDRGLGFIALQSVSSAVGFYRKVGFKEHGEQHHPAMPIMRKSTIYADSNFVVS
ncbi:hypothetical protein A2707_01190 [Candidatus Saccharibacteria bacterium RIFCSPHIGHO2_01_FULL_45_15]|nr:MAG: hypothetical protein A2707_01190 [Candidatus Saccharibacteria bacterium RIFCSPHIGHO2_01_FULL_45_15]OGL26985.1 MAG: hypothetical protein A3C39_02305 [Candidatus Saccharibacteria bacterium RIFCSPHIGHO2_02_FULL_46_12]OGL32912.1 MAG: hypothetical protein A3E76_06135 [Candidatus Saccharibacteria bacterium RIFCSPHIGHO2_12_FULL_44_22]